MIVTPRILARIVALVIVAVAGWFMRDSGPNHAADARIATSSKPPADSVASRTAAFFW